MADWTNLPNAAVGVGGLPSGTTVTALRDNPVAIAQGAAGAPRLYGLAAVPDSKRTELDVLLLTASDAATLGSLHYSGNFSSLTTSSSTFQSAGTITSVLMTGSIRLQATQQATPTNDLNNTCEIRLLKNGSVVQTFSLTAQAGTGTNSRTRNVDVSVAIGDTFEWRVRRTSSSGSSSILNQLVRANDGYTRIGIPIKVSDL